MALETEPLTDKHLNFVSGLARSRVAQTIFEQMFRQTFGYHVYPSGYEVLFADSALQSVEKSTSSAAFEQVRVMPDFRINPKNKPHELMWVEVKFRSRLNYQEVRNTAQTLDRYYHGSHLFIATLDNFFMSPCERIITMRQILPLLESEIAQNLNTVQKDNINRYHETLLDILNIKPRTGKQLPVL